MRRTTWRNPCSKGSRLNNLGNQPVLCSITAKGNALCVLRSNLCKGHGSPLSLASSKSRASSNPCFFARVTVSITGHATCFIIRNLSSPRKERWPALKGCPCGILVLSSRLGSIRFSTEPGISFRSSSARGMRRRSCVRTMKTNRKGKTSSWQRSRSFFQTGST